MKTQQEIINRINVLEKELKQLKNELLKPNYYLYAHIFPNNKYYIGIAKEPEKRWAKGLGYRANKPLYNAIQQYGWDKVKHIIIQDYKEKMYAESAERLLIFIFNAGNEHFGYNKISFVGDIGTNRERREKELEYISKHFMIKKEMLIELEKAFQKSVIKQNTQ